MKNWSVCVSIRLRQREEREKKGRRKKIKCRPQRKCRPGGSSGPDRGKSGAEMLVWSEEGRLVGNLGEKSQRNGMEGM